MIWQNPDSWGEPGFEELASLEIQETEDGRMVIVHPDPENELEWTDEPYPHGEEDA